MKRFSRAVIAAGTALFLLGALPPVSLALTPEQVIALKKAGVSEETIRLMIGQEREAKQANSYDTFGREEIKDGRGNTVIIYSTGRGASQNYDREEKEETDKAWKMLQNMIIDGRAK